jgi:hypothetical protein
MELKKTAIGNSTSYLFYLFLLEICELKEQDTREEITELVNSPDGTHVAVG